MKNRYKKVPRCAGCGGVYHTASGHAFSKTLVFCGPCTRDMITWLKKHMKRKWSKGDFYAAAATSIKGD